MFLKREILDEEMLRGASSLTYVESGRRLMPVITMCVSAVP